MKKRLLTLVLSVLIAIAFMPTIAAAKGSGIDENDTSAAVSLFKESASYVEYDTLQEAINDAIDIEDDEIYITLNHDVTEDVNIPDDFTGIIDLNDHTLENKSGNTLTIEGDAHVKIYGDGVVKNNIPEFSAIVNKGSCDIEGADVAGDSYYVVKNSGSMDIDSITYEDENGEETEYYPSVSSKSNVLPLIFNEKNRDGDNCVNIYNGEFCGGSALADVESGGLYIEGGDFSLIKNLLENKPKGTVAIAGGIFMNAGIVSGYLDDGAQIAENNDGTITVKSFGEFWNEKIEAVESTLSNLPAGGNVTLDSENEIKEARSRIENLKKEITDKDDNVEDYIDPILVSKLKEDEAVLAKLKAEREVSNAKNELAAVKNSAAEKAAEDQAARKTAEDRVSAAEKEVEKLQQQLDIKTVVSSKVKKIRIKTGKKKAIVSWKSLGSGYFYKVYVKKKVQKNGKCMRLQIQRRPSANYKKRKSIR